MKALNKNRSKIVFLLGLCVLIVHGGESLVRTDPKHNCKINIVSSGISNLFSVELINLKSGAKLIDEKLNGKYDVDKNEWIFTQDDKSLTIYGDSTLNIIHSLILKENKSGGDEFICNFSRYTGSDLTKVINPSHVGNFGIIHHNDLVESTCNVQKLSSEHKLENPLDYIYRSEHLGYKTFLNIMELQEKICSLEDFGQDEEEKNEIVVKPGPIVQPECLDKYLGELNDLNCTDSEFIKKMDLLRIVMQKDSVCSKSFYGDKEHKPVFIHLHINGYGFRESSYAIEQLKLATLFQYNYYHPYSDPIFTPLSGDNVLRPTLYEDDGQKPLKLTNEERKTIPMKHFYNPNTLKTMSNEAKACLNLSKSLERKRQKDMRVSHGDWNSLLNILDIATDSKRGPMYIFCNGGRHKTGNASLAMAYLLHPETLYGPKKAVEIIHKDDDIFETENFSSYPGEKFSPNLKKEKTETLLLNPAEVSYAYHNQDLFRNVNLVSMKQLFRLYYEPDNKKLEKDILRQYHGVLTKKDISAIRYNIGKLRDRITKE